MQADCALTCNACGGVCADELSAKKCEKKYVAKGKCHKKKARELCEASCGLCAAEPEEEGTDAESETAGETESLPWLGYPG